MEGAPSSLRAHGHHVHTTWPHQAAVGTFHLLGQVANPLQGGRRGGKLQRGQKLQQVPYTFRKVHRPGIYVLQRACSPPRWEVEADEWVGQPLLYFRIWSHVQPAGGSPLCRYHIYILMLYIIATSVLHWFAQWILRSIYNAWHYKHVF